MRWWLMLFRSHTRTVRSLLPEHRRMSHAARVSTMSVCPRKTWGREGVAEGWPEREGVAEGWPERGCRVEGSGARKAMV